MPTPTGTVSGYINGINNSNLETGHIGFQRQRNLSGTVRGTSRWQLFCRCAVFR